MTKAPSPQRKPAPPSKPGAPDSPRYLIKRTQRGLEWLYYRRKGTLIPLPGPIGSDAFIAAYDRAAASFEAPPQRTGSGLHTVDDAITHYLGSPAYTELEPKTRRDYRHQLDQFRAAFGELRLAALDEAAIERLRRRYAGSPDQGIAGKPDQWNRIRARMISVVTEYRVAHPKALTSNPWKASRRLKVTGRQNHQPWPDHVLKAVLQAATPEFRALLIGYLLTSQRGGDVTKFAPDRYDQRDRTLTITQEKTDKPLKIHVPDLLAQAIEAMRGRRTDRLFVTPRGLAWTTGNAQETLATLLRNLDLPRQTLHGLRATGPTALTMAGFTNRAIRSLTGHDSDANLETYLRGADKLVSARPAQDAIAARYAEVIQPLLDDTTGTHANQRRFAGLTGRAAAKHRREQSGKHVESGKGTPMTNESDKP